MSNSHTLGQEIFTVSDFDQIFSPIVFVLFFFYHTILTIVSHRTATGRTYTLSPREIEDATKAVDYYNSFGSMQIYHLYVDVTGHIKVPVLQFNLDLNRFRI